MRLPFGGSPTTSARAACVLAVAVLCGVLPAPGPASAEDGGGGGGGPAVGRSGTARTGVAGPGAAPVAQDAPPEESPSGSIPSGIGPATGGQAPPGSALPGPAALGPAALGPAVPVPGPPVPVTAAGSVADGSMAGRSTALAGAPGQGVTGPVPRRAAPGRGVRLGAEVLRLSQRLARTEWRYDQHRSLARSRRAEAERITRELRRERVTEARLRKAAGRLARAQYRSGVLPNALRSLNAFDIDSMEQAVRDRSLVSKLRKVRTDTERLERRARAEAVAAGTLTARLQRLGADRSATEQRLTVAREELRQVADEAADEGRCLVLPEAQRAAATSPARPGHGARGRPDRSAQADGRTAGQDGPGGAAVGGAAAPDGATGAGGSGGGGLPSGAAASPAGPLAAPPLPTAPRRILPGIALPGVVVPGIGMAVPVADRSGIVLPGDMAGPLAAKRVDGAAADRIAQSAGSVGPAGPTGPRAAGAVWPSHDRADGDAEITGTATTAATTTGTTATTGTGATATTGTEGNAGSGEAGGAGPSGPAGTAWRAEDGGARAPGSGAVSSGATPVRAPAAAGPARTDDTPASAQGSPPALHGPGPDLDFGAGPGTGARVHAPTAAHGGGRAGSPGTWTAPVVSYELSAGFGSAGSRWSHGHTGQDFAVPVGTQVRSVGEGEVVSLSCGGPFGMSMVVRHPNGMHTQYAHLSTILAAEGDRVRTGEPIALSGNTGNSTGPHLHFEVRRTAEFGSGVDPVRWLGEHGVRLRPGLHAH